MKPRHWPIWLLLFGCSLPHAQQTDYEQWKAQHLQRYESFSAAYLQRYQAFKQQVEQQWGSGSELSDQDSYVAYSADLSQKTVVDFALQEIRVEVLADENSSSTEQLQQQALQLVNQSISTIAAADPLLKDVSNQDARTLAQTLVPELQAGQPLPVAETRVEDVSVQPATAQPAKPANDNTASNDASSKRVKRVTIRLDGKNIYQRRAQAYRPMVQQQAKQYDLDSALLLAIMQVESSFNPLAQSPVPAFGLMQIVPESAGKDVNTRVFKRKQPPSAEQLFKPDDNIVFGSAYINLLQQNYLAGITNPTSRLYCAIAAYNTGAGNVASVFHPEQKKRIAAAVAVINTLSPEQVYQRLVAELPYEETRKYLQKVTAAIPQYQL